jgi:hypothetical protein
MKYFSSRFCNFYMQKLSTAVAKFCKLTFYTWEERAVYHATLVTNLAGEAFETLSENRWSQRDCTEYQDELDWVGNENLPKGLRRA